MIEILCGFPDSVVAVSASGRVSRSDYDGVLIPKLTQLLQEHKKVRCYYELGPAFAGMEGGAIWEDFKLGLEHVNRWERVAVVTDVEWIRMAVNAFRFLLPGRIRVFGTREAAEARRWISSD